MGKNARRRREAKVKRGSEHVIAQNILRSHDAAKNYARWWEQVCKVLALLCIAVEESSGQPPGAYVQVLAKGVTSAYSAARLEMQKKRAAKAGEKVDE